MNAEQLVAHVVDLRPPSPSIVKLLGLLNRPDADSETVIRIVEQDGVLSAKILSLCNSAWFGNAAPVSSVSQALLRLGYQQIHRMVMAVGFGTMMHPSLKGYSIEDAELWRHSLLSGLIAREMRDIMTKFYGDPSIAFTAALLHDIGKLAINAILKPEQQTAMRALISDGTHTRLDAEREIVGCDHCEAGASLLAKWNIPDTIVEAVAFHHAPPVVPCPKLSAVVHLANMVAHEVGSAPGWDSFAVPLNGDVPDALGILPIELERLVITAFDLIQAEPELATNYEHST